MIKSSPIYEEVDDSDKDLDWEESDNSSDSSTDEESKICLFHFVSFVPDSADGASIEIPILPGLFPKSQTCCDKQVVKHNAVLHRDAHEQMAKVREGKKLKKVKTLMSTTATKENKIPCGPATSFKDILPITQYQGMMPGNSMVGISDNRNSIEAEAATLAPAVAVYDFTVPSNTASFLNIPPSDSGNNSVLSATIHDNQSLTTGE